MLVLLQALVPLIGALAAGNTVLLKLSRHAQHCASTLSSLLVQYLDTKAIAVEATGGASMITALMELHWDHVFFTGSCSGINAATNERERERERVNVALCTNESEHH